MIAWEYATPTAPSGRLAAVVIVSGAGLIVNVTALEAKPELETVTVALPGDAISPAGTVAVSCAGATKAVANADPLNWTTAPGPNPLPFTVKVNPGPPAICELGLRLVMAGLTVNMARLVGAPPGFTTRTLAAPEFAVSPEGTDATT
jgi:hypothetical protein